MAKKLVMKVLLILVCGTLVVRGVLNGSVSEHEREEQTEFDELEAKMRRMTGQWMMEAIPYVVSVSSKLNLTTACFMATLQLAKGLKKLEPWAVKMLDSVGKLPSGLLEGSASSFGDYDECLNIRFNESATKGKYCLVEMKTPNVIANAIRDYQDAGSKMGSSLGRSSSFLNFLQTVALNPDNMKFRLGLCVPSVCSVDDIQQSFDLSTKTTNIPALVKRCTADEPRTVQLHEIVIMSVFSILVSLVVAGTMLEIIWGSTKDTDTKPNKLRQVLMLFSAIKNTLKLMEFKSEGKARDAVRGHICFAVIVNILCHTYLLPHPLHFYRYKNAVNIFNFIKDFTFAIIANASMGVENIFFIVGFIWLFDMWKEKENLSSNYALKFLLKVYLRFSLIQALTMCLFFLTPLVGSGPLFEEFVEEPLNNCKHYWWTNFIYIQNFWGLDDSCLFHTWILGALMQIFLITAGILWILERWPVLGIWINVSFIVISALAVGMVTMYAHLPPNVSLYFLNYKKVSRTWKYLQSQSYAHIGSYCIGIVMAYTLVQNPNIKLRKSVAATFCVVSVAVMLLIIFGLCGYRNGQEMNRIFAVFYAAIHRPAWTLAFSWIIYSSVIGYDGIINKIFSCKIFYPLEKLCYLVYMVHVPLIYYRGGVQREQIYMGHFDQILYFFAYTISSFLIAYACYLIFQAPYVILEDFFFERMGCSGKVSLSGDIPPSIKQQLEIKVRPTTPSFKDNVTQNVTTNLIIEQD